MTRAKATVEKISLSTYGMVESALLLTALGVSFWGNGEVGSLSLKPSTRVRSLFKGNTATVLPSTEPFCLQWFHQKTEMLQ